MKRNAKAAVSAALAAALTLGSVSPALAAPTITRNTSGSTKTTQVSTSAAFANWEDDSPTVALVKDYVADVTNPASANYIPVEDRIVTIDWDGTLFGELDPIYFDWAMYVHRTLWDSTYKPTAHQVEVAHAIEEVERTRVFPEGLEEQHAQCLAEVFAGMSVKDVMAYAAEFGETAAPKFTGMKRKDAYYKPMIDLVNYLNANDFNCYVVSGTDRTVLRQLLPEYYTWLQPDHIKGSISTIAASGQAGKDGLDYVWTADDYAVYGGALTIKNVKANKPTIITTEIGKQPVISLGNSSGDYSMANFCVNNNKYRSLALMLCCDDTDRDWGELDKAEKMVEACAKNGWHAVSQKNEWKTIYGDGVAIDKNWTWTSDIAGPNQAATENVPVDSAA